MDLGREFETGKTNKTGMRETRIRKSEFCSFVFTYLITLSSPTTTI